MLLIFALLGLISSSCRAIGSHTDWNARWQADGRVECRSGEESEWMGETRGEARYADVRSAFRAIDRSDGATRVRGWLIARRHSLCFAAGDLVATWAAGCLLAERRSSYPIRAIPSSAPAWNLAVRGSLADMEASNRTLVFSIGTRPISGGLWWNRARCGIGLASGPFALAVASERSARSTLRASVAVCIPREARNRAIDAADGGGEPRLLIEAMSEWPVPSFRALGGGWMLSLPSKLGDLRGSFLWLDPTRPVAGPSDESFCEAHWNLTRLGGVRLTVSALATRRQFADEPIAPLERATRLSFRTASWPGARLCLAFGSEEDVRCRRDPLDDARSVILHSSRNVFDFCIDLDARSDLRFMVRCRLARDARFRSAAGTPAERLDVDEVDTGASGFEADTWIDRGAGSLACASLQWNRARIWAGVRVSATPKEPGASAVATVRLPDGRAGMQTMPAAAWLLESWAGRDLGRWRIEAVIRQIETVDPTGGRWVLLGSVSRAFK